MEDGKQRKIVVEVQKNDYRRDRKRRHRERANQDRRHDVEPHVEHDLYEPREEGIPIELTQVVNAALDYGKRAHASGVIRAVGVLSEVSARLRAVLLSGRDNELERIVQHIDVERKRLLEEFAIAYDGT